MALTKNAVLQRIRTTGLMPVLRAESESLAFTLAETIFAGGIDVLEVTMTVPSALSLIRLLVKERPDILLGAGTVLDSETARICILEGAQFIVSPSTNIATIELCRRYSVPVIPGALTPTEVITAWQAGADVIKVFPASAMGGASYLKALKAPLPHVELIPTGGVSLANAADFLKAGAMALGIGADLVNVNALKSGQSSIITDQATRYVEIVRAFRENS
jgi:2-dehydro-3-deoxyphosphogluconate aldolase/(4S)-4-hydroxy-2-oxoglutarate aldolase